MGYIIAFITGVLAVLLAKLRSNSTTTASDKQLQTQVKTNEDAYNAWKKAYPNELPPAAINKPAGTDNAKQ